ncbi:TPA_asm: hypothetical protein GacPV1_gp18 [Geoglobus acetivorans pleomorphic virus 1]|uniref:Uncharacterized protein n=2 Tax=root TaxID=1 RepID=A0A0A7GEK5_GEOAI|nr:hypothetical protein GACE_1441 [Geoglobus acetivorans]
MAAVYALECSFCGSKLAQDDAVMLGCCPVCRDCYGRLTGR